MSETRSKKIKASEPFVQGDFKIIEEDVWRSGSERKYIITGRDLQFDDFRITREFKRMYREGETIDRVVLGRREDLFIYQQSNKDQKALPVEIEPDERWRILECEPWHKDINIGFIAGAIARRLPFKFVTSTKSIIERAVKDKYNRAGLKKYGLGGVAPELLLIYENNYAFFSDKKGCLWAYPTESTPAIPVLNASYFNSTYALDAIKELERITSFLYNCDPIEKTKTITSSDESSELSVHSLSLFSIKYRKPPKLLSSSESNEEETAVIVRGSTRKKRQSGRMLGL